jgi:predicted unusual protein kinase regulating ubiquinone biosynthesis (AarF/ABC1/UbiB family)
MMPNRESEGADIMLIQDPHAGNLLIRPKNQAPGSRSPYNFEVVLLDHGLYFDLGGLCRTFLNMIL